MAGLPGSLIWQRIEAVGTEHALYSDHSGLHARGTMLAADPIPFTCRYELYTDATWATARFEATVDGAGFVRSVRLERAAGRWRVTASEQGDLDAALTRAGKPRASLPGAAEPDRLAQALDMDLGYSPLTNTLPIRRLGLLKSAPGTSHTIEVAWVLVPSLEVVAATQTYTRLDGDAVRYASGTFTADVTVDPAGYVVHYPGLARRA